MAEPQASDARETREQDHSPSLHADATGGPSFLCEHGLGFANDEDETVTKTRPRASIQVDRA
jgi:hypothetical protein